LIGLIVNISYASYSIKKLNQDASVEISHGLNNANTEYLNNYITMTSERISYTFKAALDDALLLKHVVDTINDMPNENPIAYKKNHFLYTPSYIHSDTKQDAGNWWQSDVNDPTTLSVWGHLLDENHQIRNDVLEDIEKTSILDLIMPSVFQHGQWLYYVGSKERSYLRIFPTVDMASEFDASYPGHNDKNFWDFFFPNLVEHWEKMSDEEKQGDILTVTPFYEDAAGSGYISSFFYPLWDEGKFAGAIGLDFNLKHIIDFIQEVKLAQSGFAFIATQDGNIIGINEHSAQIIGLQKKSISQIETSSGVNPFNNKLSNSIYPEFANLNLPLDDEISYVETNEIGNDKSKYLIVLKKMPSLDYYYEDSIKKESMILAFVIPTNELYASLLRTQSQMKTNQNNIIFSNVVIGMVVLLLLSIFIYILSASLTKGIDNLLTATKRITLHKYDFNVEKVSNDEVGQLTDTFNYMLRKVSSYTKGQESLIKDRTNKLYAAKEEAEKAVTQLLQTQKELEEKNKKLEKLAVTDQLTHIYNRMMLDEKLLYELHSTHRYNTTFSVVMVDIDYFKQVNDTYGHQVGDDVLISIAQILTTHIRKVDILGRWGGEEFLIICPKTDKEGATRLAEELRSQIELHAFTSTLYKTASFGVSTYQEGDNQSTIISRADKALYLAKERGRNCVKFL